MMTATVILIAGLAVGAILGAAVAKAKAQRTVQEAEGGEGPSQANDYPILQATVDDMKAYLDSLNNDIAATPDNVWEADKRCHMCRLLAEARKARCEVVLKNIIRNRPSSLTARDIETNRNWYFNLLHYRHIRDNAGYRFITGHGYSDVEPPAKTRR